PYRACKPLDGFVHREETEGIVQLIELGPEEELGIIRGYKASDQQQSANDFRQRQCFYQRANGLLIGRFGKDPARRPNWSRRCRLIGLFRGECGHYRKLESATSGLKRDHAPSAYSRTPHASHTSICPLPAMMFRRWSGTAVSQFPHE